MLANSTGNEYNFLKKSTLTKLHLASTLIEVFGNSLSL